MSRVGDALDGYIELKRKHGDTVTFLKEGATQGQIVAAEKRHEFEFTQEVKDLFTHSNGLVGNMSFLPGATWLTGLDSDMGSGPGEWRVTQSEWITGEVASWAHPFQASLPGAPKNPLLVFTGGNYIGVECGPIGHGAVFGLDDDVNFHWIARSLAEYFERFTELDKHGQLEWDEEGNIETGLFPREIDTDSGERLSFSLDGTPLLGTGHDY